jgi:hypothetical protein
VRAIVTILLDGPTIETDGVPDRNSRAGYSQAPGRKVAKRSALLSREISMRLDEGQATSFLEGMNMNVTRASVLAIVNGRPDFYSRISH